MTEITPEQKDKLLRKTGFIKGLLLGAVMLVIGIASYYFVIYSNGPWWSPLVGSFCFTILLPIVVAVIFVLSLRKAFGGYWKFKEAVTGIFFMFLAAYIIQTLGRDLIFARLIEPDMIPKTEAAMIRSTTAAMQHQHSTQAQIDERLAETKKEFDASKNQTIGSTIQGIIFSVIFLFVFALVFAAIFKREAPYVIARADNE
jgi:hypothetical protein